MVVLVVSTTGDGDPPDTVSRWAGRWRERERERGGGGGRSGGTNVGWQVDGR